MKEIWKDIPEYKGIYQASNLGQIRTAPNKTTFTKRHGVRKWKVRILKGRGDFRQTGRRVSLWKDGEAKDFLVARLVAFTFYDKDINDHSLTVNHIDGNRLNNNIENLELISLAGNIKHAFDTGLMPCRRIKLYNKDCELIFRSMTKASEYIGRNHGYISLCLKNGRKIKSIDGKDYEIEIL